MGVHDPRSAAAIAGRSRQRGASWDLPLTFLSNVFVEPTTLPVGLEAFVDVDPISILATASRGLTGGDADAGDIAIVLAVAAGLTAVFAPLTTRLYRKR